METWGAVKGVPLYGERQNTPYAMQQWRLSEFGLVLSHNCNMENGDVLLGSLPIPAVIGESCCIL